MKWSDIIINIINDDIMLNYYNMQNPITKTLSYHNELTDIHNRFIIKILNYELTFVANLINYHCSILPIELKEIIYKFYVDKYISFNLSVETLWFDKKRNIEGIYISIKNSNDDSY